MLTCLCVYTVCNITHYNKREGVTAVYMCQLHVALVLRTLGMFGCQCENKTICLCAENILQ